MQEKINRSSVFKDYIPSAIAIGLGILVWVSFRDNGQDPTESLTYWQIGYPISILFSGIMGIFYSERPWRWGVIIIWIQFGLGLITSKGDLNLLPPGILFYMLLTAPCIILGYAGSWISRVLKSRRTA